mgnify:CR=1 FL=1
MNNENFGVGIIGIGSCIPEKVLSNYDLEKMVDTSDEWIRKRTGIVERRILEKDEPTSKLAVEASKRALKSAGISPEEIDLIIVATETPDYLTPATACTIQCDIGAVNAAAFDINAACSGFIYGMTIAQKFISTGYYNNVLLIGCEGLTKIVDWEDRNTCVLFGDGSGAVILSKVEPEYGILSTDLGSVGELGRNLTIPCCYISPEDLEKRPRENKRVLWMDGSEVFKFAVRIMDKSSKTVLEKAGLSMDQVKLIVPHQANIRIIEGAAKRLGISQDKIYSNIHKYGNISSASIPVGIDELFISGKIQKGDNIIVVGFGGGLTWAAGLIRWSK